MTTNQTIDGVPGLRDLLERLHAEHVSIAGPGFWAAWKELRALLDAPKCKTCCDQGEIFVSKGKVESHMLTEPDPIYRECPDCLPAAQPQGTPVADLIRLDRSYRNGLMAGFQFGITGDEKGYAACIQRYNAGIQEAKAEQPAPVTNLLPPSAARTPNDH